MKILKANAGALTNFEVLEFLRSRGAGKDATRVIAPVAPSEYKVFDYLEQSVARYQTKESITDFISRSEKFKLAKAEIINVINIRPSSVVELDSIVEDCDGRFGENIDELVDMVAEVFPLPNPIENNDGVTQEAENGAQPS
ncbi:hypothetical protein DCAR_0417442 [Daucus carota subsp. sativus]|uniref:DNA-directed RNA polymerase III subunit RPC9 n=1 Tax=Daucus carota subsp. sativus TaxID=79200 RepID=A0AAF1AZA0_DAUCS|nr:PREDICTED: DNA-directed RNA polymerase III subunit rpc9-like [Daucus carota subsp. sativus]WOG98101.1 hypothetical protein DCAR_0417442 [Daucus carota subsp. sativus]